MTARPRGARRRRPPAARRLALAAAFAAALAATAGCGRGRFEPVRGDSTRTTSPDTFAVLARDALARWEAGDGESAARATAALLLADLRARTRTEPGFAWRPRAEAFLDSLGVGAEVAADPCAMIVNFFSRSAPDRGSWPWLFTCGAKGIDAQPVEGGGLRLVAVAGRGLHGEPPRPAGARGVAALYARRGGAGLQPMLFAWAQKKNGGPWEVVQSLGPDSLGGTGTAEFAPGDTAVTLTARTYRPTPRFEECATCPHVYRVHRFAWSGPGFVRVEERTVPSPYATFVRFATAVAVGDDEFALEQTTGREVLEAARRFQFGANRGAWRVAPATDESARFMVFMRGRQEAYRVTFESLGPDEFRIAAIEPAPPPIE
uniref:Uncharacterized protein n=1 Tax=Eiseniibacteriota bacterium TaxID=2212470 RepID=A0A832MJ38_UNCEI